jgi:hypothetical protein
VGKTTAGSREGAYRGMVDEGLTGDGQLVPAMPSAPVVPMPMMPVAMIIDVGRHAMAWGGVVDGQTVGLRSRNPRGSEHEQACHSDGPEQNFVHSTSNYIPDRRVVPRAGRTKTQQRCLRCRIIGAVTLIVADDCVEPGPDRRLVILVTNARVRTPLNCSDIVAGI